MNIGDKVYYIVSGRQLRAAVIKGMFDGKCVLAYGHGAVCLPIDRAFARREEAEAHIAPAHAPGPSAPSPGVTSAMQLRRAYDFSGKP